VNLKLFLEAAWQDLSSNFKAAIPVEGEAHLTASTINYFSKILPFAISAEAMSLNNNSCVINAWLVNQNIMYY
jgi:hypothetical protein